MYRRFISSTLVSTSPPSYEGRNSKRVLSGERSGVRLWKRRSTMSTKSSPQPASPALDKAARDNRANQLNPNNPAYKASRGENPPSPRPGSTGKGK